MKLVQNTKTVKLGDTCYVDPKEVACIIALKGSSAGEWGKIIGSQVYLKRDREPIKIKGVEPEEANRRINNAFTYTLEV